MGYKNKIYLQSKFILIVKTKRTLNWRQSQHFSRVSNNSAEVREDIQEAWEIINVYIFSIFHTSMNNILVIITSDSISETKHIFVLQNRTWTVETTSMVSLGTSPLCTERYIYCSPVVHTSTRVSSTQTQQITVEQSSQLARSDDISTKSSISPFSTMVALN